MIGALVDTTGSFVVPLLVIGAIALIGAFNHLVIMGRIEPLTRPAVTLRHPRWHPPSHA